MRYIKYHIILTTDKSVADQIYSYKPNDGRSQGPLLLTWFNFNPSMDKLSPAW